MAVSNYWKVDMATTKTRPPEYTTVEQVLLGHSITVCVNPNDGDGVMTMYGQITMENSIGFILMCISINGYTEADGPHTKFIPWSSVIMIDVHPHYNPSSSK